jgi:probable rRNA maturation factor
MDVIFHIDDPFLVEVDPEPIRQALLTTAQLHQDAGGAAATSMTVTITDNETIQQLNYQYRGIDAPTDVLSFENVPDPDFPEVAPVMTDHLGDIIIAYPVALAQATVSGHTTLDELILLAVHGLLHLLGFDHDTPKNREKMWAAQHRIMASLGLAHVQPTEN